MNPITNWELGRSEPAVWFIPGILELLGYDPFGERRDALPFAAGLKAFRRSHDLSQKRLDQILDVDPSTLAR